MEEPIGVPPGPPPPPPPKNRTWMIIVAVIVVFCCCCFGSVGLILAFGGDILYELGFYALLPVLTVLP